MNKINSIYNNKKFYLEAIRNPWYIFLTDLYHIIFQSSCDFYRDQNIRTLLLPTTSSSVSSPMGLGSDSTPVEIILNNKKVYLSDSMQFLLEYGCRFQQFGCYSIMPSYRGEEPDNRHLSQFFHSEAEIIGDMKMAIDIAEKYLKYITNEIYRLYKNELLSYTKDLKHIENLLCIDKIKEISLDEAISLLNLDENEYIFNREYNFRYLTPKGEEKLIDYFNGIVWITELDHLGIPFYQAFNENSSNISKAADLLMGMGETIGLGERHCNSKEVIKALDLHKIPHDEYKWYIELKEKFPLKTAGYGLGVERYICWLINHSNIQDCQLFLRFNNKTSVI